jgi:hypothetical protein
MSSNIEIKKIENLTQDLQPATNNMYSCRVQILLPLFNHQAIHGQLFDRIRKAGVAVDVLENVAASMGTC